MRQDPPGSRPRLPRLCPICDKPAVPRHFPFCSSRCKAIDLGRWLRESYRFATDEGLEDEEDEPEGR